jgi:hypothetical protein
VARVGVVPERRDLAVAEMLIEAAGLDEVAAGVEPTQFRKSVDGLQPWEAPAKDPLLDRERASADLAVR